MYPIIFSEFSWDWKKLSYILITVQGDRLTQLPWRLDWDITTSRSFEIISLFGCCITKFLGIFSGTEKFPSEILSEVVHISGEKIQSLRFFEPQKVKFFLGYSFNCRHFFELFPKCSRANQRVYSLWQRFMYVALYFSVRLAPL